MNSALLSLWLVFPLALGFLSAVTASATEQSALDLSGKGVGETPPLFFPMHRPRGDAQQVSPEELPLIQRRPTVAPERVYGVTPGRAVPGITIGIPSGYGASWRSIGVGVGLQKRKRYSDDADGVVGLAVGFGDASQTVGLQLSVGLVDMDDPLRDGSLGIKVHRQFGPDLSVAAGKAGFEGWGQTDGGDSLYAVVSKRFELLADRSRPFGEVYVSLGIGGGQFRPEDAVQDDEQVVGVFGSLATRLAAPVNAVVEWTGQDLSLGISYAPFPQFPLVIVPALTDLTRSAGDGTRFILGIGYSTQF